MGIAKTVELSAPSYPPALAIWLSKNMEKKIKLVLQRFGLQSAQCMHASTQVYFPDRYSFLPIHQQLETVATAHCLNSIEKALCVLDMWQ